MSTTDNMGGFLSATLISISEIDNFQVRGQSVSIALKSGCNWQTIPITHLGINIQESPSLTDAGVVYGYQIQIKVPYDKADDDCIEALSDRIKRGVVIRCTDASGSKRVFGTDDYPLVGYFGDSNAPTPAELRCYLLFLSNNQTQKSLRYRG